MRTRILAALGLLLADLGIFITVCTLLPQRGRFGHSGPWSYFVNSRDRWDIAWGTLVAAVVISAGAFMLMESLGAFRGKPKATE